MKKIFFFILTIISLTAFSQSRIPIRGDSIVIEKLGGNAELILLNGSRNLQYGYLQNIGNGRTKFHYALDSVWIEGDSLVFRYGPGTLKVIHGGGGGGTTYAAGYGLNLSSTTFKVDTANISTKLWRQKGIDSILGLLSSNYYTQTQINSFFGGTTPIGGYNKIQWDAVYAAYTAALANGGWVEVNRFSDSLAAHWAAIQGFTSPGNMNKADYDPDNNQIFAVAQGGSGVGTLTGVLIGNGTSPFTGVTGTASQLLRRNAANTAYEFFTNPYLPAGNFDNIQLNRNGLFATPASDSLTYASGFLNNKSYYQSNSQTGFNINIGGVDQAQLWAQTESSSYIGVLRLLRGTSGHFAMNMRPVTMAGNNNIYIPYVNGSDTLATLHDVRAGGGGGGSVAIPVKQIPYGTGSAITSDTLWTRDITNQSWTVKGTSANPYPYTVYKNYAGDTMALHTVGVNDGTHYFDYNPSGAFTIRSRIGGGTATPQFTVSGSGGSVSARGAISWQYNSGFGGSILGQLGATSVSTDSYGTIQFGSSANAYLGNIYTDVLTANRIYKTPNRSGTIALREDIADSLNTYRASDSLYLDSTQFSGAGTISDPITIIGGAGGGNPVLTTSASTSLSLTTTGGMIKTYVFTGSSAATWTLPAVGTTAQIIKIKNRGTASLTIQRAGSNQIFYASAVNSINLLTGDALEFQDDGTYWIAL